MAITLFAVDANSHDVVQYFSKIHCTLRLRVSDSVAFVTSHAHPLPKWPFLIRLPRRSLPRHGRRSNPDLYRSLTASFGHDALCVQVGPIRRRILDGVVLDKVVNLFPTDLMSLCELLDLSMRPTPSRRKARFVIRRTNSADHGNEPNTETARIKLRIGVC